MPPAGQLRQFQTGQFPDLNRFRDPVLRKGRLHLLPADQSPDPNLARGEKAQEQQDNQLRVQDHQVRGAAGIPGQNLPLKEMIIQGNPDHLNHHAENNKADLNSH
jgi:hypothetical protein